MDHSTPFIKLLRNRRSIRQFTQQPIPDSLLIKLQEAVLRSPSSRGKNPWSFIFIDDRKLLEKISQAKMHGSSFLSGAALAVVVCADSNKSDVWIEDCSIAAITLQYAAQDLDLGSCWVQIRNRPHDNSISAEDYLKNILKIEDPLKILCIVGLGYPGENKPGHGHNELQVDKITSANRGNPTDCGSTGG